MWQGWWSDFIWDLLFISFMILHSIPVSGTQVSYSIRWDASSLFYFWMLIRVTCLYQTLSSVWLGKEGKPSMTISMCVCLSHSSEMSQSLWPTGLWPVRPLGPWNSQAVLEWVAISVSSMCSGIRRRHSMAYLRNLEVVFCGWGVPIQIPPAATQMRYINESGE